MAETILLDKNKNNLKIFRKAGEKDFSGVKELYLATSVQNNGIARTSKEITDEYINKIVFESIKKGIIMVAEENGRIIGSINALKLEPECFSHILSDLTFLIHPSFQGKGVGKGLFGAFMEEVNTNMPEIIRIELFVRKSNEKAVKLYESFGFQTEGILRKRIKNSDGIPETDTIMAWIR